MDTVRSTTTPPPHHRRQAGFSVAEVVIAATIFAIALMSSGLALLNGARSQDESEDFTMALRAVRDVVAEMQDLANLPNDVTQSKGIGALFSTYDGTTRNVPTLPNGTLTIECFADEESVPAEFGGPQDLNFDGDDDDDLANQGNGSDMKYVPTRIDISFTDERGTITRTYYRSFTQTTD